MKDGMVIKYPFLKFKNECLKLKISDYYENENDNEESDNESDNKSDNESDNDYDG